MDSDQSKFEDMLHQIAMTSCTYLSMALKISEAAKKLRDRDQSTGKVGILNNPYYQILQTTAKAYTDEGMCCISTLLSEDQNEISIKKYDNKFKKNLSEKIGDQRAMAIELKVKDYRDWFVAHKDKRMNKNPYLNDLFGYKEGYIADLASLSSEIFNILSRETVTPSNNYFSDKVSDGLDGIINFCSERIKKQLNEKSISKKINKRKLRARCQ